MESQDPLEPEAFDEETPAVDNAKDTASPPSEKLNLRTA